MLAATQTQIAWAVLSRHGRTFGTRFYGRLADTPPRTRPIFAEPTPSFRTSSVFCRTLRRLATSPSPRAAYRVRDRPDSQRPRCNTARSRTPVAPPTARRCPLPTRPVDLSTFPFTTPSSAGCFQTAGSPAISFKGATDYIHTARSCRRKLRHTSASLAPIALFSVRQTAFIATTRCWSPASAFSLVFRIF
jgi:hypothetical protein